MIYDLDGTIISTTKLHEQGWQEAGKSHDIDINQDFLRNQKGMANETAAKMILGEKFATHGKSFVQAKEEYVNKNTHAAGLFENFLDAYKKLKEHGVNVWVCTSARRDFALSIYNHLFGLQMLKDNTVSWEMYKHGKPDPEPILLTAKLMGLPIQDCVYVGDAYNDYLAVKSAGCSFIYFCRDLADKDPRIPDDAPVISNHTEILSKLL